MKFFALNIFAALLVLPGTDSIDSDISIVLKHSTCHGNKKYIDKITSTRKPINRTTSLVSLDIYVKPGVALDSPLYMRVTAYKKFTTQYRQFMVDLKIELCEALKLKSHPMYGIAIYHANRTETNMLDQCPLKGHKFAKPYYTMYKYGPPLVPTGMWRTDITVIKELDNVEEEIFRLSDYYEVSPTGIVEF